MQRPEVGRSLAHSKEGQGPRVLEHSGRRRLRPPCGQGLGCRALWLGPGVWGAGKRCE